MNLFEIINRLQMNERDYWDYYQGITVNPIVSPQRANEFINEFFTLGSKEGIFQNQFIIDENDRVIIEHTTHTIKVFFIGIYLQQQIDRYLSINSSVGTSYPFSYLWYLCCLFHDYGYRFEQKTLTESDYTRITGLEERGIKRFYNTRLDYYKVLKTRIRIVAPNIPIRKMCYLANTFSVFAIRNKNKLRCPYELCNKQCNGIITFSNGKEILNSHYTNRIKNRYFKYIIYEHNHMDHGISGADYMYYKLTQNYRSKCLNLQEWENPMNFIDENNRHFHCEHFKIFAYISDCISCHNIWKASKDKEEVYKKYSLDSLVGENFKIVSYHDNPLLFILCLADSIEPTKKINNIDESEVLKNIGFEYCNETNKLIVSVTRELSKNDKCRKYIENLKGIEDWIDIKLEVILIG